MTDIITIVIYSLLVILFAILITLYRYKRIRININQKKFEILNHDYFIRILLSILNFALIALTIYFIIKEESVKYILIVSALSLLVSVFLIMLIQLYTLIFLVVYANNKIYLFSHGEIAEFERSRVHFAKNNNHTQMYYKDDLVFDTKKNINLKNI